jgi:hypothetical protein
MQLGTVIHSIAGLIRSCTRSRLGWLLACVHAAWFFLAIANMSPPSHALADFLDKGGWSSSTIFAGRPFHFHYESTLLKSLILVDWPSMLVEFVLGLLAWPLLTTIHPSRFAASYFDAALLLLIATCQWLVVGNEGQTRLVSKPWGAALARTLNRYFVISVALILLFAVVFVPIVNERSRRLGFRHPAISFH